MSVPIKLKRKYLTGFRSSQKSSSNISGVHKRSKLNQKQKEALPPQAKRQLHVFYVGRSGHAKMEIA